MLLNMHVVVLLNSDDLLSRLLNYVQYLINNKNFICHRIKILSLPNAQRNA